MREEHCDVDHLCTAAKLFASWSSEKKQSFLDFLDLENLDWYSYSIGMDQGKLLKKFNRKEKLINSK